MADTRGVFTLQEIIPIKLEEEWVALSNVWIGPSPFIATPPNTGYFGGGYTTAAVATMDKVTYSSDTTTAVPGAALSAARSSLTATGNSTNGYFGGGDGLVSTMDKVTYATDSTAAVV